MLKGIPVSKEEFKVLVKQIPKGIGIEPSKETLALRKELEQLKIGETLKYPEGIKKNLSRDVKDKEGNKTGKTKIVVVDENQQKIEGGVRWYNKNMRDFIVMYKVDGGFAVTKIGPDVKKTYTDTIEKKDKEGKKVKVPVFLTSKWRKETK